MVSYSITEKAIFCNKSCNDSLCVDQISIDDVIMNFIQDLRSQPHYLRSESWQTAKSGKDLLLSFERKVLGDTVLK